MRPGPGQILRVHRSDHLDDWSYQIPMDRVALATPDAVVRLELGYMTVAV